MDRFFAEKLANGNCCESKNRNKDQSNESFRKLFHTGSPSRETTCGPEVVRVGIKQHLCCKFPKVQRFGRR
jgi:hypothetical protein